MMRTFFEIFLLVSFCCTAIIAAANSELLRQENCGVTSFPSEETDTNKVRLQDYPWIVGLKYKAASGTESKIHCLGTLISRRYILTSAICTKNFNKTVEAILGSTEKGAPPPQAFNISKEDVTVHPNYTPTFAGRKGNNNIALIRLPKDVDDSIVPICLPIEDDARNNQFERNLTEVGWFSKWNEVGLMKPNELGELKKVSVPVVPNAQCAEEYSGRTNISEKLICVRDVSSHDVCGRFGGNLLSGEVILDGVNKTVQYGIVTFAVRRCDDTLKKYPRVYTRISAYIDWILDNIKA